MQIKIMSFLKFLKKLNLKFVIDNVIFVIILWVSYLPRVEIHTFCNSSYFERKVFFHRSLLNIKYDSFSDQHH